MLRYIVHLLNFPCSYFLLYHFVLYLILAPNPINHPHTSLFSQGNISVEIVRAGLARVHDRSLTAVPKDTVLALRVAEREALTNHRFIWSTTTTTAASSSSSSLLLSGAGIFFYNTSSTLPSSTSFVSLSSLSILIIIIAIICV